MKPAIQYDTGEQYVVCILCTCCSFETISPDNPNRNRMIRKHQPIQSTIMSTTMMTQTRRKHLTRCRWMYPILATLVSLLWQPQSSDCVLQLSASLDAKASMYFKLGEQRTSAKDRPHLLLSGNLHLHYLCHCHVFDSANMGCKHWPYISITIENADRFILDVMQAVPL